MTETPTVYEAGNRPPGVMTFSWQGYSIGTELSRASFEFRRRYGYGALAIWYDEAGHVFAGPIREVGRDG